MRYCPPMIFAHRVLYERGDTVISRPKLRELFGVGGSLPGPEDRWLTGRINMTDLIKWDLDKLCYGDYVGFRNRDDQFLFFLTFQGNAS